MLKLLADFVSYDDAMTTILTNILWRNGSSHEYIEGYRTANPNSDLNFIIEADQDKAEALLPDIDILVDGSATEALLDAPKLKHVIVPWVGVTPKLRELVLPRTHLTLHNSHYNAPFVAQHALALLLACSDHIVDIDVEFRKGDWRKRYMPNAVQSTFLVGKTALLVGYGAIGKGLEPMLVALGMTVKRLRRTADAESYGVANLPEAVAEADVIVCSLPGTPETEDLFDEAIFLAMRENAIFINVGRANVTNEQAFFDVLKAGKISAGLDVWWNYPKTKEDRALTFPANLPFHELPNVVMSPHRSDSMGIQDKVRFEDVLVTIEALAKGEMRNLVNLERGY